LLYTAKGAASFLVPAASWLQEYTGGWHAVFAVATVANLAVAATALLVVKPLRSATRAELAAPRAVRAVE
jgi:OFA family oxalate/formate antiporter-like MFS transporter